MTDQDTTEHDDADPEAWAADQAKHEAPEDDRMNATLNAVANENAQAPDG